MKNYAKTFKLLMWALSIISVVLLVWGFITGFTTNEGKPVDVLLGWAYVMIGIAVAAIVVIGLAIGIKNNPKSLVKLGIGIAAVAVVCIIAYAIAPGKPAMALTTEQPADSVLKLTDTILNITYFAGAVAIISIVFGEILMAVRNK